MEYGFCLPDSFQQLKLQAFLLLAQFQLQSNHRVVVYLIFYQFFGQISTNATSYFSCLKQLTVQMFYDLTQQ